MRQGIPSNKAGWSNRRRRAECSLRNVREDESNLVLIPDAAFCTECYASFPTTESGDALDTCLECGKPIETYSRFSRTDEGEFVANPGYADVESGWDYAIDHWAHDDRTDSGERSQSSSRSAYTKGTSRQQSVVLSKKDSARIRQR